MFFTFQKLIIVVGVLSSINSNKKEIVTFTIQLDQILKKCFQYHALQL